MLHLVGIYTECRYMFVPSASGVKTKRTERRNTSIYNVYLYPTGISFVSWPCCGITGIKIFYYFLQSLNELKTEFNTYHA